MAEFKVTDESLSSLKDKVVVVTGSSSGIGLATVQLLLSQGASVFGTDLNEPAEGAVSVGSPRFAFRGANVTEWKDLVAVFKAALELHGRVDHVFANAGIAPRTDYVTGIELDEAGDPKEPTRAVLDVNLKGAINTAALGVHYIRQNPGGGSVVINASASALQRFRGVDYAVAKHGAIGLMRGLHAALGAQDATATTVRVNALAPSWTGSGMVPAEPFNSAGIHTQTAGDVARAAAGLMADGARRGNLVHVDHGVYKEVDEALLLPAYRSLLHAETLDEDEAAGGLIAGIMGNSQG
ncbi:short chain dehydrogenase [Nemania sp. NC0429]|nr:short chain dehydrogenase [Nemania sp. NC0429]